MNNKILVITQCFPCGSWLSIEKIIARLQEKGKRIYITGLGKPSGKNSHFNYFLIPYIDYNRYGFVTTYSPLLGILWDMPLFLISILFSLIIRPQTVIYNGFGTGLILSPIFKLLGKKNIIMYHSVIKNCSKITKKSIKLFSYFADLVIVNSEGSKDDLKNVISDKKIIVNEHFADDIFFSSGKKFQKPHTKLKILYVGRIDIDKLCFPLINFANKTKSNDGFEFIFVGSGKDVNKVKKNNNRNIVFLGYIHDKVKLSKLYRKSDVVWSFADTTYLGLPAIEAIASDTPIIIPKYSAVAGKRKLINIDLVPRSVGWLIDPFNSLEIEKLLTKIRDNKEYSHKKCYEYAKEKYSKKNIVKTVHSIINFIP